jgi:hypothetical protein
MAILAFGAPFAGPRRRRWLRRAPLAIVAAVWAGVLAVLFAAWLAAPAQRNLALAACETLGRAGLRCPTRPIDARKAPDCASRDRGGYVCPAAP